MKKFEMRLLQLHVADHCNFFCDQCSHASPFYNKQFYSFADYKPHLMKLLQYAKVKKWDIMGGEPLLKPDYALDIILGIRNLTSFGAINIVTNGSWLKLKNYSKHIDAISFADHFELTIHPEIGLSSDEIHSKCKEITKETGVPHRIYLPLEFLPVEFDDLRKERTTCKFCPQIKANGFLYKCHLIAYQTEDFFDNGAGFKKFNSLRDAGKFNISLGDVNSLEEWYNVNNNGLHECCHYCRYMDSKQNKVKHKTLKDKK